MIFTLLMLHLLLHSYRKGEEEEVQGSGSGRTLQVSETQAAECGRRGPGTSPCLLIKGQRLRASGATWTSAWTGAHHTCYLLDHLRCKDSPQPSGESWLCQSHGRRQLDWLPFSTPPCPDCPTPRLFQPHRPARNAGRCLAGRRDHPPRGRPLLSTLIWKEESVKSLFTK